MGESCLGCPDNSQPTVWTSRVNPVGMPRWPGLLVSIQGTSPVDSLDAKIALKRCLSLFRFQPSAA